MDFAAWKDRKNVAQVFEPSIARPMPRSARPPSMPSHKVRGREVPAIAQSWRRNWDLVIPFFAFPEGVRKIIYTTNAIEALNSKLAAQL